VATIPLYIVDLQSSLVSIPVMVGLVSSSGGLPNLGNDLAGNYVMVDSCVSPKTMFEYVSRAHKRSFNAGNEVLVLLPIPSHPLQAHYSGPYIIEEKVNDVMYSLDS